MRFPEEYRPLFMKRIAGVKHLFFHKYGEIEVNEGQYYGGGYHVHAPNANKAKTNARWYFGLDIDKSQLVAHPKGPDENRQNGWIVNKR